jgi:hypothetical protein
MDQQTREQAFMNALATEHFVLQAGRSAIVGEQVGGPPSTWGRSRGR